MCKTLVKEVYLVNIGKTMCRCFLWIIAAAGVVLLYFAAKHLYQDNNTYPQEIKEVVLEQSGYNYVTIQHDAMREGPLILVNNSNLYGFAQLDEMVTINEYKNSFYKVSDNNQKLNIAVMEPLNRMMKDFNKSAGNNDIMVTSGYRSFEEQESIYNNRVLSGETKNEPQWVAVPGGSEHHTGYSLDLGLYTSDGYSYKFDGNGIYSYILDNAYKYGFILRYPEDKTDITGIFYEAWHFRYIGHPHAYYMESRGMCLEEYIEYLKSFPFDKTHLYTSDFDGTKYEIYYVMAEDGPTSVPVPENREYIISGNNVDGFIVTAIKK